MHLERAKIKGISQHLWAGMHMCTHRHLEKNSQPLIRVEQQLVTMVQSEGQLCHSDGYTKSQTLLAKAATVTSKPQAGKSRFGSRQRKFSRSLALTSCCHGAEKLHEQPHTKLSQPSPRASGYLQDGLCKFTLLMGKYELFSWTFLGAHCRIFKEHSCPSTSHPPSFLQNVPSAAANPC